jgi:hypothetical protein
MTKPTTFTTFNLSQPLAVISLMTYEVTVMAADGIGIVIMTGTGWKMIDEMLFLGRLRSWLIRAWGGFGFLKP